MIFAFSAQEKEQSAKTSTGFSYQLIHSTGNLLRINWEDDRIKEIAKQIDKVVRKTAHMTEYAVLAVLVYVWMGVFHLPWKRQLFIAIFLAACYAGTDELHQVFVPGRAGRVSDVVIDSLGAVVGVLLFCFMEHLVRRK